MAGLTRTGDAVRLTIPLLGSVTVGPDTIEIGAPEEESVPALWARLGDWADAQWWLRQGVAVIPGTAAARDGRALLLTGRPRQGASLLALALAERGWRVVADAVVPWAADGTLRAGGPAAGPAGTTPVTVDSPPMAGASFPNADLPAGRARSRVAAPAAGDTTCAAVVILHSSEAVTDVLVRDDQDGSLASRVRELFLPALVPGAPQPAAPEIPSTWMVSRPTLRDGVPVTDWGPARLADHLADLFGELIA